MGALSRAGCKVVSVNGIPICVRDGVQSDIDIAHEVQSTYPIRLPLYNVVDLGAHIGSFAAYMRHFNPTVELTCVEVDADNFDVLTLNAPDARLYHRRVGYDERHAYVAHVDADNTGGHCVVFDPSQFADVEEAPPRITLEDIIQDDVDLLKIDIEGGEFDVLMNCDVATLCRCRRIMGERHNTRAAFDETIGARLSPYFRIWHIPHPVPAITSLGLFICDIKE